jgi:hypothetical protein
MGMNFSNDPVADAERRDVANDKWLAQRNVCFGCKDYIQEEYAYRIEGHLYCENCVKDSREYFD